jgi:hypothetical protein
MAQGTLTIAAGATVTFDENTGLEVATEDYEASLVVDGSSAGVVFGPSGDKAWDGITIGDTAKGVSLAGLTVLDTTGGVKVTGAEVTLGSLSVDGASAGCGLTLEGGARFADGAAGLSVKGAGDWSVCAEVGSAASLPSAASDYTGNTHDGGYLTGSTLGVSATWDDLGVPYVIAENVDVAGTAEVPAVLTVEAGTSLQFTRDRALRFSRLGEASQLVVAGTAVAPVTFAALGADTAGYWQGIEVSRGAAEVRLAHAVIRGAGSAGSALVVDDAPLFVDGVRVERSGDVGVELRNGARFSSGSADLTVTESGTPLVLPAASVPSMPTIGVSFTGNTHDAVKVAGDAAVRESGTWPAPGVPYWVTDDVAIDGTAGAPAIVTLSAGSTFLFDNNTGILVGRSGAAGLVADGTAEAPISMEPWSANTPGAWMGVGLYENTVPGSSRLAHLTVGYAGGSTLKGNVHLVDASPTLDTVYLHDGEEWGLYLNGSSAPSLSGVTYANNGSGTCSACE